LFGVSSVMLISSMPGTSLAVYAHSQFHDGTPSRSRIQLVLTGIRQKNTIEQIDWANSGEPQGSPAEMRWRDLSATDGRS